MSESFDDRTANLVGAFALTVGDRVTAVTAGATGRPVTDTAALVILSTTLDGGSQDALARVLRLTQTGGVRLVDRLVAAGLVARTPGPDGRTRAIVPTGAGRAAAERALAERRAATRDVLAVLDDAERAALTGLLEKLLGAATADRAAAFTTCRLCDTRACGHEEGRCPVTLAADRTGR